MRTSERMASRAARRLRRRGLHITLLAIGLVALQASKCAKDDFYDPLFGGLDPTTGDIFGRVTVDGEGRSGVTVTIRQGTAVVATDITDGNGDYEVLELDPGTYTVSISEISGVDCPGEQTAVVVEDDETERNFACTTPEPETGTVTGTVTVNDQGASGVTVTLLDGSTTIATTTTGTDGSFQFTNVPTGTKTVVITPPEGATCATTEQSVDVPANGTAGANFSCTQASSGFDITFGNPAPGYCHIGPGDSRTYAGFGTSPLQAGATYSIMWSGPGTVGGTTRTGTLDAGGTGFDEQGINLFGMYTGMVSITSGGNTETASTTVDVTAAQGACQQLSSLRFKQGVLALLPADVRPLGLRPVAFRYVEPWGDPAVPRIGLIAEEVAGVFPRAVLRDGQGRPSAIDYRVLTGAVVGELEVRVATGVRLAIARLAEAF